MTLSVAFTQVTSTGVSMPTRHRLLGTPSLSKTVSLESLQTWMQPSCGAETERSISLKATSTGSLTPTIKIDPFLPAILGPSQIGTCQITLMEQSSGPTSKQFSFITCSFNSSSIYKILPFFQQIFILFQTRTVL